MMQGTDEPFSRRAQHPANEGDALNPDPERLWNSLKESIQNTRDFADQIRNHLDSERLRAAETRPARNRLSLWGKSPEDTAVDLLDTVAQWTKKLDHLVDSARYESTRRPAADSPESEKPERLAAQQLI